MLFNLSSSQSARKCPKCHSTLVRRSSRKRLKHKIASLFNFYPYRCTVKECSHRFQGFGRS